MSNTINQFMWGYQIDCRVSLESLAERCFNKLTDGIFNDLFLVGILRSGETDRNVICIEPEDSKYQQSMFKNVKDMAAQLEAVSPEKHVFHSLPEAQTNHNRMVTAIAHRDAVLKCIEQNDYFNEYKTFVSSAVNIEKYNVHICLQLNRKIYDSFYKLNKDFVEIGRLHISKSIIDSLVMEYFSVAKREMEGDNTATNLAHIDTDDLIRKAGNDFMHAVSVKGINFGASYYFYQNLNIISSLPYESQDNYGRMIICKKDHENIKYDITFINPVAISEHRKIRKILEMTSENLYLISDAGVVYGLGHIIGEYNPIAEDLFVIHFTGHYMWELLHDNKHVINVKYTNPFLPTVEFKRDNFSSDMKRIFNNIEEDEIVKLYTLVYSLLQCNHGAILVICSDAKEEAERLKNQSLQLKPFAIDENTVKKFSNIDGAILIDENGICYSIGAILDGIATDKGDSSRGSRYNSSIRYYEQRKKYTSIAVIIVSEDGMVDFIPYLRPVISHNLIYETIRELLEMENEAEVNTKKYYSDIELLYKLEFYLNQDECNQINAYRKRMEPKLMQQNNIILLKEDLQPNPECNETYFSDNDNNKKS